MYTSFVQYDPFFFNRVANLGSGLQVDSLTFPYFLVGVAGGDAIPSGFLWGQYGYIEYGFSSPPMSMLLEGVATYLGVRLDLGAGNHYGWIGVERTGKELDAFAWGYETDPGVSIVAGVPEPGTLALLAFGAGAAATRRRRRDHSN